MERGCSLSEWNSNRNVEAIVFHCVMSIACIISSDFFFFFLKFQQFRLQSDVNCMYHPRRQHAKAQPAQGRLVGFGISLILYGPGPLLCSFQDSVWPCGGTKLVSGRVHSNKRPSNSAWKRSIWSSAPAWKMMFDTVQQPGHALSCFMCSSYKTKLILVKSHTISGKIYGIKQWMGGEPVALGSVGRLSFLKLLVLMRWLQSLLLSVSAAAVHAEWLEWWCDRPETTHARKGAASPRPSRGLCHFPLIVFSMGLGRSSARPVLKTPCRLINL